MQVKKLVRGRPLDILWWGGGLGCFPKKIPVSGFERKNNLSLKRVKKNNLSLKRAKKNNLAWPEKKIKKYPGSQKRKILHFILFL